MTEKRRPEEADALRALVRDGYTRIVEERDEAAADRVREASKRVGYSEGDLDAVPAEANLGVGCGNPTAIDSLKPGETVVDLGSGAGMDAFLAARQVGPQGRVIGVDMTEAMVAKARENARRGGFGNVEFRQGQIESLPIDDESVDVVLSNCVINLSPEKDRVYREAYRVLRPGGRAMISDIVLERPLPPAVIASIDAYIGCVGGASLRGAYLETIRAAGFDEVHVTREASFADALSPDDPQVRRAMDEMGIGESEARDFAKAVTSLHILAVKAPRD